MKRTRALRPAALLLGLLLTACGSAATTASQVAAKPKAVPSAAPARLTRINFSTDYNVVSGLYAPYYVALRQGYYRQAGLDVHIQLGRSGEFTLNNVANGTTDIGIAGASLLALSRSQGAAVKMVAMYLQKDPSALIYNTARHPITSSTAICHRTIALSVGSESANVFHAFVDYKHIPASCLKLVYSSPSVLATSLLDDKIDAFGGYGATTMPTLDTKGIHSGQFLFADHGLDVLGSGLIASDKLIRQHPGRIRAFIAATNRGWRKALADPKLATQVLQRSVPKDQLETGIPQTLALVTPLLQTPNSKGHVLGWMSLKDWRTSLTIFEHYFGLKHPQPVSDYYTNKLLPSS